MDGYDYQGNIDLQSKSYQELIEVAPEENELSILSDLEDELQEYSNDTHDNFLDSYIQESIGQDGVYYTGYAKNITDYKKLLQLLKASIDGLTLANGNGAPQGTGAGGGGGLGGVTETPVVPPTEPTNNGDDSNKEEPTEPFHVLDDAIEGASEVIPVPPKPPWEEIEPRTTPPPTTPPTETTPTTPPTTQKIVGDTSQATTPVGGTSGGASTNLGNTGNGLGAAGAGAALGTTVSGATAAIAGEIEKVGGLGSTGDLESLVANNPFGDYEITKNSFETLTETEQNDITDKFKEIGFTDSEIAAIKNGESSVPQLSLDAIANQLETTYQSNPAIREEFIKQYGFDPFNADGTINKDKLSLALVMDNKSQTDGYSIITTLHSNYGVDIVDQNLYSQLSNRLETELTSNPSIRSMIKQKYGFDVFNEDGTVSRDKLSLAMLMDGKDLSDDFDLNTIIGATPQGVTDKTNLENVVNPLSGSSKVKKSGSGLASILTGIGLLGTAGSGVAVMKHKKKEKEEQKEKTPFIIEKKPKQEEKKNKEWLEELGVNIDGQSNK